MKEFFQSLNRPLKLREIKIESNEQFAAMALRACGNGTIGGLHPLNADAVTEIYQNAF